MDSSGTSIKSSIISYVTGDLIKSTCQCLVNPVNTVGVMGRGLALQFKRSYPEMMESYIENCQSGAFMPGRLMFYKPVNNEKTICLFPTKLHWREPSNIQYIESGLIAFMKYYQEWNITSVAFPRLGCGLGGLNWTHQVKPLMEKYLSASIIPIEIYE